MEHALAMLIPMRSLRFHHAAVALPADLHHFAVFDENRYAAMTRRESTHPATGLTVAFDVVFNKIRALPFQPLAHLLCVWAPRSTEKLKLGHGPVPPEFRGLCGRSRLALLECAECSHTEPRWGSLPALCV